MATHVASPHNTRPKAPHMPQEDIRSVLERFHKWAGHQAEPVRELTYEEAVARSRRRAYANDNPIPPEPVKIAASPAPVAPPSPIPFPVVNEPPAIKAPGRPSNPSPANAAKAGKKAASEDAHTQSAAAKAAKAEPTAKPRPPKRAASRTRAESAAKPGTAQKESARKAAPRAATTKSKPVCKTSIPPSPANSAGDTALIAAVESPACASFAAASAYAEMQKAASRPEPDSAPETTFAEVLTAQIHSPHLEPVGFSATAAIVPSAGSASGTALAPAPIAASAIAPLPDDVPAVHLTVRLAVDERDALRERARDLGMTPSAYVRQCALEIDSLRVAFENARLAREQASAALTHALSEPHSADTSAALCLSPGTARRRAQNTAWFTRLRNFIFARKAKTQAFATRA